MSQLHSQVNLLAATSVAIVLGKNWSTSPEMSAAKATIAANFLRSARIPGWLRWWVSANCWHQRARALTLSEVAAVAFRAFVEASKTL